MLESLFNKVAKSNIYSGVFFTLVKPYFKNVLNSVKLPLGSIFYTTQPLMKKLTTLKTSGQKVLTMEHIFFFEIGNYATASSIKMVFQNSIC